MISRDVMKSLLKEVVATVTFEKKDGTERTMKCTLNPDILPPIIFSESKKERKIPEHSIAVFDLDLKEWRSFIVKSVKSIKYHMEKTVDNK